jgi:16S rRNA (cytosine967-C5)-methyltransferase
MDKPKRLKCTKNNPREAAYFAVLASIREERFVTDELARWKLEPQEQHFARELAFGTVRMAYALDDLAIKLSKDSSIKCKVKERALLRLAIYEQCYMSSVPLYATVDEYVALAKKILHPKFASFINALLRRFETVSPQVPNGDSAKDLSIRYSYPIHFVKELIRSYGVETCKAILQAGNTPSKTIIRYRGNTPCEIPHLSPLESTPLALYSLDESSQIPELAQRSDLYIQNATPSTLMHTLASDLPQAPESILDLCSSPGGKLLSAHDLYPEAKLFANDVSERKLEKVQENLNKYSLDATLSCSRGEEFHPEEKFDLVIIDAPCSNTGVLNKRPEARWRLGSKEIQSLKSLQLKLIRNACTLLKPNGCIWYLSCSILPQENEELIAEICESEELIKCKEQVILPNTEAWDGGYACSLRCKSPHIKPI